MEGWSHDRSVEAEVLAALVATPAVLATAGAAFTAGRAQARAALRGPVDSVRRAAQREAYAALLVSARTYLRRTQTHAAAGELLLSAGALGHELLLSGVLANMPEAERQRREALLSGLLASLPEAERQRWVGRLRAPGGLEPLNHAVALVSLEGPDHLVPLAEAIEQRAEDFQRAAQALPGNADATPEGSQEERQRLLDEAYERIVAAVLEFVIAARGHLNGEPPSRIGTRTRQPSTRP